MGTGIVAVAASSLPVQSVALRTGATAVWGLAVVLLVVVTAATVTLWVRWPAVAMSHLRHPVMRHFSGAPPMAVLTVGAGALLLGRNWIGLPASVTVDWVLWTAGTVSGLLSAVLVPFLVLTRHDGAPAVPSGAWLMSIVPPMVSASTGALLVPYAPAGQARETLFWGCWTLFGLSLAASSVVIVAVMGRFARHGTGEAGTVPTIWIVLGPIGQSITAANLLATAAPHVVARDTVHALLVVALVYGFGMLGAALLWAAIALTITVRVGREHLPFSLTWWSFTFPVGTCVTGMNGLALHSGLVVVDVLAVAADGVLVVTWVVVAARTLHGVVVTGALLRAPDPA
jgi:tellurite resistance protein TehA-like permease